MDEPGDGRCRCQRMQDGRIWHRSLLHIRSSVFPARPAFIRFPVMVNHLEFCRDKLYFRADEFFPYFHHRTPAVIAYLFPFIYGMPNFVIFVSASALSLVLPNALSKPNWALISSVIRKTPSILCIFSA